MKSFILAGLITVFVVTVGLAYAGTFTGGVYSIKTRSVNSGGSTKTQGAYTLSSSTGQPGGTGLGKTGGPYALDDGFWGASKPPGVVVGRPTPTFTPAVSPTPTPTRTPGTFCESIFRFECIDPFVVRPGNPFALRLQTGDFAAIEPCEEVPCSIEDTVFECTLTCLDPDDETKPTCLAYLTDISEQFLACFECDQQLSAGILSATTRAVEIGVVAPFACHWCVCGVDIGHPCNGETALPLANCYSPILCGGVTLGVVTENRTNVSNPLVPSRFDMNGDGAVDAADLILLIEERAGNKSQNANKTLRCPDFFKFSQDWGE